MARYYYAAQVSDFLVDEELRIFGELCSHHPFETLTPELKRSWKQQIALLKQSLRKLTTGHLFFEFSIPRMGKRVDNVLIVNNRVLVIEFKIGYGGGFDRSAKDQVIDYTLDLKNFHEGSHDAALIPILVVTNAEAQSNTLISNPDLTYAPLLANNENLESVIELALSAPEGDEVNVEEWSKATYRPTPTIVEAAKALYSGHKVEEIARTDAGDVTNLSETSDRIQQIIDEAFTTNTKAICFVTGVPGAGKTLAGLNIAIRNMDRDIRHATYMSGNGPLVEVLREALSRDRWQRRSLEIEAASDPENPFFGTKIGTLTLAAANDWARTIIQAIHEFRADQMETELAPTERVVIFDESQRAWTREKLLSYLGSARPDNFDQSEPQFLIGQMNRHEGFCTIVCLVGGGQEIHDGEAGLEEWFRALREHFPAWSIHYSDKIISSDDYLRDPAISQWLSENGEASRELHLSMPVRSFRSEKLAEFVEAVLAGSLDEAIVLHRELSKQNYPVYLTRNLSSARRWLKEVAQGTNRTGLVASSGAGRLKPHGVFVKNKIKASDWFLKGKEDVRSSYYLEDIATEFDIQGLELDWVGVCWDGDFYFDGTRWKTQQFSGTSWKDIRSETESRYLKNKYRVLLTRARQGMILFVPRADDQDVTRPKDFYDNTFEFLKQIGIPEID